MFIAFEQLVIPLRQERHVTEHAKHIALRWSAGPIKDEAINIVLLWSIAVSRVLLLGAKVKPTFQTKLLEETGKP